MGIGNRNQNTERRGGKQTSKPEEPGRCKFERDVAHNLESHDPIDPGKAAGTAIVHDEEEQHLLRQELQRHCRNPQPIGPRQFIGQDGDQEDRHDDRQRHP